VIPADMQGQPLANWPLDQLCVHRVWAHHVLAQPEKIFLTELSTGRQWTYQSFDAWTNQIANALQTCRVKHGSHVGIWMDNSAEHWAIFIAIAKLGAVAVPINTAARGQLLQYYLSHADIETLIIDEEKIRWLKPIANDLPKLQSLLKIGNQIITDIDFNSIDVVNFLSITDTSSTQLIVENVACHDLLILSYTSGTTGPSKASMLSQAAALSYATGGLQAHGFLASDVVYVCLPLFHNNALLTGSLTALMTGSSIALATRFSVSGFWREIRQSGATVTNLLGAMSSLLWATPAQADDASNTLRLISMSPIVSFVNEFEKRFDVCVVSNYGLSDFATVLSLTKDAPIEKRKSIGKSRSYYQAQVVDDNDMECANGVVGELVLRSLEPWRAATSYYKMPEETTRANRNQWFHTGDRAYADSDGYYWFVDRKKDCIRRRGENISAFEVEQIILSHTCIAQVAVFPVSMAEGDEEVGAAIVWRENQPSTELELIQFCAQQMAYYMVPRFVKVMDELPVTINQKIEKYKIKQRFEADTNSLWDTTQHLQIKRDTIALLP